MKRILITGSRDWTDTVAIHEAIIEHAVERQTGKFIATIVHGACPTGADLIASQYCRWLEMPQEKHPADWSKYGKRAGFVRNKEMVDSGIDLCLAFVKNKSKGATMTVDLCRKAGVPVELCEST